MCEKEQIDLLLIAGDLFHRQPLLKELKEVNYLFSKMTHTKVVLIAGNHDYIRKDSYYLSFRWGDNVYTLFDAEMDYIEFAEMNTCVYGLSYHAREIKESVYKNQKAKKLQPIEILLAHGGDEKHIPIKKQELLQLEYDYIALGHIHKPGIVEENRIYYSGSLEPLDKNETGEHGYILGEIGKGQMKVTFISSAKREYRHEKISVVEEMTGYELKNQIERRIEEKGKQNLYKIMLKGFRNPEVIFDLEQMDTFGNIVEIIDETKPAYDFEKVGKQNQDNILGKFIEQYKDAQEGSIESVALYEGVQAIFKTSSL